MKATAQDSSVREIADAVGIMSSMLCALHCLIVPMTLLFGPIGALSLVEDEFYHRALLFFVVPAAVFAFGIGCRSHRDRWVLMLGLAGLLTLTAALTVLHDLVGENGERGGALLASGLMVVAHVRNFRLCRRSPCNEDHSLNGRR